jgi:hypothetical protein
MTVRSASGKRRFHAVAAVLGLSVALVTTAAVGSASAAGTLSCRASVVNAFGIEPIVANAPNSPCHSENKALVFQTFANPSNPTQFISVEVAHAQTVNNPGPPPSATAHADAARVVVSGGPGMTLTAEAARADARVSCGPFHPEFSGSSSVASLTGTFGGQTQTFAVPPSNQHQDVSLGQLGTIHFNEKIFTPNSLTVRAVWFDRPAPELDVIIGEATVDFTDNPCIDH